MKRALVVAAIAALLGACGGSSDSSATPDQTITVEMRDIAYAPSSIDVKAGELIELVFENKGKLTHDAFIGDEDAQRDHAKTMRDDETQHDHGMADASAITVKPGKTGTLRHRFDAGDDVLIGCHESGHYRAGMRLRVNVT